jgi:transcription elongation GreA/GreB family factor
MQTIPFTKVGFDDLKIQLETVISKRPNAVKALTRGREMGDLSENGLYKAAKMELGDIDRQIRFLKNLIKYGMPSIPSNDYVVQIGHKLVIEDADGTKNFQIVGEYEANPKIGKISYKSPIGNSLIGKRMGELVRIQTPQKEIQYKIISIDK